MLNNIIIDKLNKYDRIILAVSGGSDSMAMLAWFINCYDKAHFSVLNIEHGIRGVSSISDSEFVENYCMDNKVECIRYNVNALEYAKSHKLTIEQAARQLRRKSYRSEIACHNNAVIATAHHASDQTETILMNIFRGSGMRGLCGMSVAAVEGIIHPLIHTSKSEIMRYIADNNVPYREDESNSDTCYSRNYLRSEIISRVTARYGSIDKSIARLAANAADIVDFITTALPPIDWICGGIVITTDCHKVLFAEQVHRACRELGVYADIEQRHIELVAAMIGRSANFFIDLPYSLAAYKEYDNIVIAVKPQKDNNIHELSCIGNANIGGYNLELNCDLLDTFTAELQDKSDSYAAAAFEWALLPTGSILRTRRDGDYIIRSGGRKSLGDYFTDCKILPRMRDNLPLIACGSEILVVCGEVAAERVRGARNSMIKIALIK